MFGATHTPGEAKYKKGHILYQAGEFHMSMLSIHFGRVGIYAHYKQPEEKLLLELGEGDFVNVISFLEARPRTTTVVALDNVIVHAITPDNFSDYFSQQPAKIMSLLQHMSARMRHLSDEYEEACIVLEEYADVEKLKNEKGDWYHRHTALYDTIRHITMLKD